MLRKLRPFSEEEQDHCIELVLQERFNDLEVFLKERTVSVFYCDVDTLISALRRASRRSDPERVVRFFSTVQYRPYLVLLGMAVQLSGLVFVLAVLGASFVVLSDAFAH